MQIRLSPLLLALSLTLAAPAPTQEKTAGEEKPGTAAKAEQDPAEAKAREARFKAKGFVKVKDVWVAKEHVKDAKKGVYHHDGDIVNHDEIKQLQSGMVRHPLTGRFIPAADLGKARDQFPLADGKWGSKEEANKYHSNSTRPWIVRTTTSNVASTLPIDTILYKVAGQVDAACRKLMPIFGGVTPPPDRRPTVVVMPTQRAYASFGDDYGDGNSAHGAFLTPQFRLAVDGSEVRVGAAVWDKNWGPYYVRHAAGLAFCHALLGDQTNSVPDWFHRAVGGYVERHYSASEAKFFGAQHAKKGGVSEVKKWLDGFKISPDLPARGKGDIGYNIYQAGLLLSFSMRGGDKAATDALQKVTAAFVGGKKPVPAILAFGKVLSGREAELQAFLQKTVR